MPLTVLAPSVGVATLSSMSMKVALIGSHGVGKTTLVYGLAARLKRTDIQLEVVVEVARRCPLEINENTNLPAQSWILHNQIADETYAETLAPVVLCDRSVLDNYAYLLLAKGPQSHLEPLIEHWINTYDLLVHVPIVDSARGDGVRSTDQHFRQAVDDRLAQEIEQRRIDVVQLDASDRDHWLDVLERVSRERLRTPQLELLG